METGREKRATADTPLISAMRCPACGQNNLPDSKYCSFCSFPFTSAAGDTIEQPGQDMPGIIPEKIIPPDNNHGQATPLSHPHTGDTTSYSLTDPGTEYVVPDIIRRASNRFRDYSAEYMPRRRLHIILVTVTFILALGAAAYITLHGLSEAMYITGVIVILCQYFYTKLLRCPACDCRLCWTSKDPYQQVFKLIPGDKHCPSCGVKLRP